MAPRTIGPFEIDRQIGLGGMGIVYSAIYPENGKKVALKVLSPALNMDRKLLKRFEREIEILKRLKHPNIVKYYGGGTENGQRYYAMEFIDGGSLQEKLQKRGQFSWEQTLHVGRQVASALEHAHNAGVIHRDLKPANLFLSKKGRLKLGDFGIARDTEATALTAAGKTVGTYAYMAPEQIQATHPITRKTDLYALGCLLYEVIVGETPFLADSSNPMDMLMQHLNDDPYNVTEKVPNCPIQLDNLIERLLAKDPDERPFDALAVHTELGEIRDAIKAGENTSKSSTVAGASMPSAAEQMKAEARKKRKKKKKKKDVPFHERTWFLVTCLVGLLAATIWMLLPPGEDWYAEQWRDAMAEGEYSQRETLEAHIDPYLEKFPTGSYIDEAIDLSNKLHANMLEPKLKNSARLNNAIDQPFKAACVKAARAEDDEGLQFFPTWDAVNENPLNGNPVPALERWSKLIVGSRRIESPDQETQWLIQLCHNHYDYFRTKLVESPEGVDYVRNRMVDAEKLFAEEKTEDAQAIWLFTFEDLGKVEKFRELSEYAKLRYNLMDAEIPGAEELPPTDAAE